MGFLPKFSGFYPGLHISRSPYTTQYIHHQESVWSEEQKARFLITKSHHSSDDVIRNGDFSVIQGFHFPSLAFTHS